MLLLELLNSKAVLRKGWEIVKKDLKEMWPTNSTFILVCACVRVNIVQYISIKVT